MVCYSSRQGETGRFRKQGWEGKSSIGEKEKVHMKGKKREGEAGDGGK